MKKFIEFCKDYWFCLSQPDTVLGLFLASCFAAFMTLLFIFG